MIAKPSTSHYLGQPYTIVVVGGGYGGVMTAANLLRSAPGPLRVILIERRANVGGGSAFGDSDPCHLLCEPTLTMGAYADDTGGFARWCNRMLGISDPDGFRPRAEYARYLEATLACAAESAADGVDLIRMEDEVVDIRSLPGARLVETACGRKVYTDHVILALGNGPPRIPDALSGIVVESDLVSLAPCDEETLRQIKLRDRILVLGTGLTMYDTAISLARRGFVGEMMCLSRHGLTPCPYQHTVRPAWVNDWAATLPDLHTPSSILCSVRHAMHRAQQEGTGRQAVIEAIRMTLPAIWSRLDNRLRAQCVRHLQSYWNAARVCCAPEVDAAISLLRYHRILSVVAGRLLQAEVRRGRVHARIRLRGRSDSSVTRFDHVIVCTGMDSNVTHWPHSLAQNLIWGGLLTPDPLHLGVLTTLDARSIARDGSPVHWMHVIGQMRQGPVGADVSVRELRSQASDIAGQMTRQLVGRAAGRLQVGATAIRMMGEA